MKSSKWYSGMKFHLEKGKYVFQLVKVKYSKHKAGKYSNFTYRKMESIPIRI